jgi:hypothetical protein
MKAMEGTSRCTSRKSRECAGLTKIGVRKVERLAPGSQLFGLLAISRFLGLDENETTRRIGTGEVPVQRAGSLLIANKAKLRVTMESSHFQRAPVNNLESPRMRSVNVRQDFPMPE